MKWRGTLFIIFTITLLGVSSLTITLLQERPTIWEVYFSPHGGCTEEVNKNDFDRLS